MITPHVHIFGIPVDKLDFKKDYLDMIQSQADESSTNIRYVDFDNFFDDRIPDLDWAWIDYDNRYTVPYVIGIRPEYSWNLGIEEPFFHTEQEAREFIAEKLELYVTQAKEWLALACDYLDIPEGF